MKTCLIVDHSCVIRKVVRKIIEGLNFTADEAEESAATLEKCRAVMSDAILLDSSMPTLSGVEFLRSLRREPNGDKLKVLYCLTENDVQQVTEMVTAGANDYLLKPFDKDFLHAKFADLEFA